MAQDADRTLLFGLLALHNGLIDQIQLVAAFQAWTRRKVRPLLVAGGADGLITIWDLETGQETLCLKGHTGQITSLTFSPDRLDWPPSATTNPSSFGMRGRPVLGGQRKNEG
jgi:hypothetical protein